MKTPSLTPNEVGAAGQLVSSIERAFSLDQFELLPRQRLLLKGGKPVRIGGRAFDILLILLERAGERVSKAELLARVWPDTHVVEGNLKCQVAALRRALRDGQGGRRFVDTSQGQGYSFVAPVTATDESERQALPVSAAAQLHNLPQRLTPLLGRTEIIGRLAGQLEKQRLLTIVGPGGIGKTSVAIAVAERLIGAYEDGVWLVDLARNMDPTLVRSAVAGAVGMEAGPEITASNLVAALRSRRMLLVIDNCAHVVDAAATLALAILKGAPHVHILATSREPLRIEGEHLCRLGPLETPPPSPRLGAAEALRFPAVQLFVQQAKAAGLDEFQLSDDEASAVAEICRKLDGIPLAIELASARVGILGVSGLAAQLDDRMRVLTSGLRTALPQHRTLRATLDWSHDLLSAPEQTIFRRLAVFVGGFTLAAAATVCADASHPGGEIVTLVLELVDKSLVATDVNSVEPRFRLLDTTRAYALERIKESGELERLARRHAIYFRDLFEFVSRDNAEIEKELTNLTPEIDNLRAALRWAFTPPGDLVIGIGLAAASVGLWLSMSLVGECHAWAERAIRSLDKAGLRASRQEMILQAALGISFQLARAMTSEGCAALTRALELAEQLNDSDYQLHILHSFWVYHMRIREVGTSLALARRAEAIALSLEDSSALTEPEWMLGVSLHFGGEHAAARQRLEEFLQRPPPASRSHYVRRSGFDLYVVARYVLAHVLWVQGYPDQAMRAVRAAVEEARHLQHPNTLCSALAYGGCALSLRTGDLETAGRLAAELLDRAEKYDLADYLHYGTAVQAVISLRERRSDTSIEQIRVALQRWRVSKWHIVLTICEFAEIVAGAGHVDEISAIVDEALEQAKRNQEFGDYPEALRLKGELLLLQAASDPGRAEEYFVRSLELARAQGALSWELRVGMSFARLALRRGNVEQARDVLSRIYARFEEGFDSADLQAARQLLSDLSSLPV